VKARPKLANSLFKRAFGLEIWNVGIGSGLDLLMETGQWGEIRWRADPGPTGFLADPVGVYTDETGEERLLVEELSFWENRGRIVSLSLGSEFVDGAVRVEIDDALHLSYPFTIQSCDGVELYPECGTSGRLRRFVRRDLAWAEETSDALVEPIIDPTFCHHNGLWYLFYTRADSGPNDILHLKFSTSLKGPWTEHPAFPRARDATCTRPAGPLFKWRDRLFRPAQDCSESYGGTVVINEVEELSANVYREKLARRLDPPSGLYDSGLHSFLTHRNNLIIDAKRISYGCRAFIVKCNNLQRRLLASASAKWI